MTKCEKSCNESTKREKTKRGEKGLRNASWAICSGQQTTKLIEMQLNQMGNELICAHYKEVSLIGGSSKRII